jgi:hypothetical protein
VGLERGPLSIVCINEDLPEWKSSGFGSRKQRLIAVGIRCADHATLYPRKLALTSPTSGGRSIGIVRLRTKSTAFSLVFFLGWINIAHVHCRTGLVAHFDTNIFRCFEM